jgi:hypothetical protein
VQRGPSIKCTFKVTSLTSFFQRNFDLIVSVSFNFSGVFPRHVHTGKGSENNTKHIENPEKTCPILGEFLN